MSKRYNLNVRKSLLHVYVEIKDLEDGRILASDSTLSMQLKKANVENCFKLGKNIAKKALDLKLKGLISYERNQHKYHGKIQAIADGAREGGLEF